MNEYDSEKSIQAKDIYGVAGKNEGTINQYFVSQASEAVIQTRLLKMGSPYLGLNKFQTKDKDKFFGREQWICELSHYLLQENNNILLLLGASGSGKSSLIRAGLIPRLEDTWGSFLNLTFEPDVNPFESLYACLINNLSYKQSQAEMARTIAADSLVQVMQFLKQDERRLIFIDQFEELFTRTPKKERDVFIASLVQLIKVQDRSIKIVLTMRADFLGQLSPYAELGKIHDRYSRMLTDMSGSELELAIKEPAARNGVVFESGLVEEIIHDYNGESGSLPLLQYTLNLLWENEDVPERVIKAKTYEKLGRVTGALQTQADRIYRDLNENQKKSVQEIFFELVDLANDNPVSRRTNKSLFLDGGIKQDVLEVLIEKRLLVGRGEEKQATVEVAHEALLRTWDVLQQLIQDRKDIILLRGQLTADAKLWRERREQNEQRARNDLWSGWKLERVLDLKEKQVLDLIDPEVQEFVKASHYWRDEQSQKERKIARKITVASITVAVLMAVAAIFSVIQARQSEIGQIQASVALSAAKFANNQGLEADIESIRAGKTLEQSIFQKIFPDSQLRMSVLGQLQQTVNTGHERNRLEIHQGRIASVAVNPNGKQMATIGYDGIARLWDAYGRQLTKIKSDQGIVNSVVFSPDGKQLATSGDDGNVNLWDVSGNQLAEIRDNEAQVASVVFSPNGNQLAIASVMPSLNKMQIKSNSNVTLWTTSGNRLAELKGLQDNVSDVVFSPDGKQIATIGSEDAACLWDTSGKKIAEFKGHQRGITSVSFSPNGKQIATSGNDDTIRLWEISGKQLKKIIAHQGRIRGVIFSPDGKQLVTMSILSNSHENMVSLWNTSGEQLNSIKVQERVRSIVFSPDGKQLATSGDDGIARLWNGADNHLVELKGHQGRLDIAVFSPDGRQLVTNGDDGTVRLWDTFDSNLAEFKGSKGTLSRPLFSPNGKQLITIGDDDKVRLWDTSGKQVAELKTSSERTNSVVFSPNGKYLVTNGDYGRVRLWDTSGNQLVEFKGHQGFFTSVVFSPDGKQLATSGNDDFINLKDIFGNQNGEIKTHQEITNLVFSPSGKYLATSGNDSFVRIWNTSGKQVFATKVNQKNITNIQFSPDGQYLAIDGEGYNARSTLNRTITVTVWNIFSNQRTEIDNQQKKFINGVVFSPNSKNLATSGDDGLTRLWDTSGKQLAEFKGHQGPITSVVFSPDGKQLATTGNERIVRLWDTSSGKQLSAIETYQWSVASAVFSPDGKQLATSGYNDTRLWQVGGIDDLLGRTCDRIRNYLKNKVTKDDRNLCDGIGRQE
jgi:WD40 repeat protein